MAHKPIKMELFKSGKHKAGNGVIKVWTNDDIDKIVSNFNAEDKAPACIGHPTINEPAMGWFNKIWREGNSMFGELGERVDEFNVMLKKKLFPRRSISLDNNLHLKHVGFLGVRRPAIAGLAGFKFAASESEIEEFTTIEFAEHEFTSFESKFGFKSIARIFQNLRDKIIEDKDIDTADATIPQFGIEEIEAAGNQEIGSSHNDKTFSKKEPNKNPEDPEMEELETAKARIKELEEKNTEFSTTIEEQGTKITILETEKTDTAKAAEDATIATKNAEFGEYLDGLIKDGKMLPANKEANLTMLMDLDGKDDLNFSEDGETKKTSQVDIFKASLEGAGEVIQFSEFAKNDTATERIPDAKLSKLTHERAKEKDISFSEAGDEIMAENPDIVLQHNIQSEAGGK